MTGEIKVSDEVYRKILECHEITGNKSLNITIVDLALFFLRHKEKEGSVVDAQKETENDFL